jgi:glycosyltransferase involved in cell wall biosynthesis
MRIAHVITTISRGGAELQLLLLVEQQIQQGHEVEVFPLKSSLDLLPDFQSVGARIDLALYKIGILSQVARVRASLFQEYDVIHAHLPQAELVSRHAHHSNFIVTRHFGGQFFPAHSTLLSKILSRYAVVGARCVVAISNVVANMLLQTGEIPRDKALKVIHYGFSKRRFFEETKQTFPSILSPRGEAKSFSCFARLSPEKNLLVLLEAWAIVLKDRPNWKLQIFGIGAQEHELEAACQRLGLHPKEILVGSTKQVYLELKRSDAIVLPSLFEGFGMVLLEAMYAEVPLLVSDIPIFHEVVGKLGAGLFFNPYSVDSLAESILNLFVNLDPDYKNHQRKQLKSFDISYIAREIEQVYLSSDALNC